MRLDEIKARAAAATEGPWVNDSTEIGRPFPGTDTIDVWVAESCHPNGDGIDGEADAEFIAHARTDVPRLVAALESVLELHQPYITRSAWQTCNECWNSGTAEIVYPCPTVAAIRTALGEVEQ